MNVTDIRRAVADALSTVEGLRVFAYEPDSVPTGDADVAYVTHADEGISYQEAFHGGLAMIGLAVELSVQMSSERSATERMDALLSSGAGETRSVIDALGVNRTLGGLTGGLVVVSASRPTSDGDAIAAQRRLNCSLLVRIPIGRL